MSEMKYGSLILELTYGAEKSVDGDVDLFEVFYKNHFREDALVKFEKREGLRSKALAISLCFGALLFIIPMVINPSSIFAAVLLALGCMILAAGFVCLYHALTIKSYCERHFDRLLAHEFAATRSITKRVFEVRLYEQAISVTFGSKTAIKQLRTKLYEDIQGIYLSGDLIFIQGLTWISRFQMKDREFCELYSLLNAKCSDRFFDWKE